MGIKEFMVLVVKFIGLVVKISLEVLLPMVDVVSDVYFTVDVYNKGDIKYFITSGIFFK